MGLLARLRSRFGLSAARPVATAMTTGGGWSPVTIREPYTGAWQDNAEITIDTALTNPTVFRCCSLIAGDISKTPLRLVQVDANGVWTPTTSNAFSPVLRKPNRYQTIGQFIECWVFSKLLYGNAYVLKGYDDRGVVDEMHVLDARNITPLVAPDGSVYYQLQRSDLAGLGDGEQLAAPARDVMHDRWNCAFHPLVGISPLYGCGADAIMANLIRSTSSEFFSKGGRPSGVLSAPTQIDDATANRLSARWHALGPGKTAIVDNGMKYQDIGSTAVDSQLTEQREGTVATIAGCFGVPVSYVDSTKQPPYANSEATQRQYHAQCLQVHMVGIENTLDEGLALPVPYGTEFDLDALIWMDTDTRVKAAREAIGAGMTINEARIKFYGLPPVEGGDTVYLQQQMFSLAALAERDANMAAPPPSPSPTEEDVAAASGAMDEELSRN